jgi:hypothetical protein
LRSWQGRESGGWLKGLGTGGLGNCGQRAVTDRCSGVGARPSGPGSRGVPVGATTAGEGAGDGAITEHPG